MCTNALALLALHVFIVLVIEPVHCLHISALRSHFILSELYFRHQTSEAPPVSEVHVVLRFIPVVS